MTKKVLVLTNQRGRAIVQAAISSIALVAASIMASEFWEDMTKKEQNMPTPRWAKPFLFAALCVLIGLEGTKVREDFKVALGGPVED